MNLYTEENLMIDKFAEKELTAENFKEFVLEMERDNLKNIDKADKKVIVTKIVRVYEEARKDGNK